MNSPAKKQDLRKFNKGQPRHYEERKKRRTVIITDTAWEKIRDLSQSSSISVLIEEWIRSL
jgi:hypothetical protein